MTASVLVVKRADSEREEKERALEPERRETVAVFVIKLQNRLLLSFPSEYLKAVEG